MSDDFRVRGAEDSGVDELKVAIENLVYRIDTLERYVYEQRDATKGFDNLIGDADNVPDSGFIEFDRTDNGHPVIRFRADRLPQGGGGGEIDVVTNVVYDTEKHKLMQYKRTVSGITVKEASKDQLAGEEVFETTPISAELFS